MIQSSGPAQRAADVTPSDATILGARALFVGTTGDLAVVPQGQTGAVTFQNVPVGFFPVSVAKVMSTNTTASDIVALY